MAPRPSKALTEPDGATAITNGAPDGAPFNDDDYPYSWSQSSRERGAYVKAGSRPYHTAIRVVGGDGIAVGKSLEQRLDDLLLCMERLRVGMIRAGYAEDVSSVADLDL